MKVRAVGETDVGRKRDRNEDALLVDEAAGIFAVADGMGGHAAGHVASATALEVVKKHLADHTKIIEEVQSGAHEPFKLLQLAERAVQAACQAVYARATDDPQLSGMGCTLTLAIVAAQSLVMAHVGDTRLYLFRDGDVDQLSTDHTLEAELLQRGMPTAAKAYPNVLTRSLGQQEHVHVDTLVLDLQAEDVLLLCSDGLHGYLEGPGELATFLAKPDLPSIPAALIDIANDRGGQDNITAITLRVEASDEEQEEALELGEAGRRRVTALRAVELFYELPFSELVRIMGASTVRRFEPKQVVIRTGEPCDFMVIVTQGLFELKTDIGDFSLDLKPGNHMGDTMLLVQRPCRATLTAKARGELLVLRGEVFQELVARRPWLGVTLLMRLARALSIEFADLGSNMGEPSSASRSSRLFF